MGAHFFFNGWESIARTATIAVLAYPAMLMLVRLNGHRTLAQLNAFDFIVTVALGSTLATALLSKDVALAQGIVAFAFLIGMQHGLSRTATWSNQLERLLNGEPTLLACRGEMLFKAMKKSRITNDEVLAALRSEGLSSLKEAEAVVLETNGRLSVVRRPSTPSVTAVEPIAGYVPRTKES